MNTVPQQSETPAAPVAQPAIQPAAPAQPEQATSAVVLPTPPVDVVQAAPEAAAKPRRSRSDSPANGLVSSKVNSIPTMRAIWKDHYEKGLSYEAIEKNAKYGLRHAKGMTAYRLCRKYEAASDTKRPTSKK
jgi:hypothetical protein